ncbi:redoxin domain-containing protein [bacterium]|nr:redoxin domain-containing protein [bacterium]
MQTRKLITLLSGVLVLLLCLSACNEGGGDTAADSSGSSSTTVADSGASQQAATDTAATDAKADADSGMTMEKPGAPGTMAADFTLTDMSGAEHHLADYLADGKTVVLEWFNPGCSVVHYYYKESTAMVDAYKQLKDEKGDDVVWLAVISQDPAGRGGTDEEVNTAISEWGVPYPVLRDGSGVVGKSYGATRTPALYVISPDGQIQYNGALDQYQKGGDNPPVGTNYVIQAVHQVASGEAVSVAQTDAPG